MAGKRAYDPEAGAYVEEAWMGGTFLIRSGGGIFLTRSGLQETS